MVEDRTAEDRPAEDIFSFKALLTRDAPEGDLGITFVAEEGVPGVLVVTGVLELGPVDVWNTAQAGKDKSELTVCRGDRVLAVCGQPREWPSAAGEGSVAIAVQQWQDTYNIKLERENATDKLGMKLELVERAGGNRILRIGATGGGLLAQWNSAAAAAERWHEIVTPGTEVAKVGDLESCPEDMMTSLQEGSVRLTLRRPEVNRIETRADMAALAPGA